AFCLVQGCHHFSLRVKSNFSDTGTALFQTGAFQLETVSQIQKSQLGRVSQSILGICYGVTAECESLEKPAVTDGVQAGGFQNVLIQITGSYSHAVLCQSSCFI